jgi:DNA-binding NtrC family response regulator
MIGRSRTQQQLFDLLQRAAPCVRTALVTGETGTGKELVARALHALGPRADRPLIVVNCAMLGSGPIDAEGTGQLGPAYAGAPHAERALFEHADGATLFLDEIAELPPPVQAQLLRVLEHGEVPDAEGLDAHRIDLIAIASTSRDLAVEAAAGRFRRDLYYRLSVVHIPLAPLRERRQDIPLLTDAFISEFSRSIRSVKGVADAAERLLERDEWPGNVRELRNVLQRACIRSEDDVLSERTVAAAMSPGQIQAIAYRHVPRPYAAAL